MSGSLGCGLSVLNRSYRKGGEWFHQGDGPLGGGLCVCYEVVRKIPVLSVCCVIHLCLVGGC